MASNAIHNEVSASKLGVKVKGDLGDIQIIEEGCESDRGGDRHGTNSRAISALSNVPSSLVRPTSSPSFESVIVKDSKNVQFGNNTYFNGPVTIKQVIQHSAGHDNSAYTKTDDEDISSASKQQNELKQKTSPKKFKIHVWHKVTCSAVCVVIIGGICAVVSVFLINHSTDYNLSNNSEDSSYCSTVMVSNHGFNFIFVSIVTLMLLTFLLLLYYLLFATVDYIIEGYRSRSEIKTRNHFKNWMREDEGSCTDTQQYSYADSLLIGKDHLRIVSRSDWLAQPTEDKIDKIRQPVPWVIITHTATDNCSYQSECVLRVRLIQMFHIESRKWSDIGYNFLVGGDGSAYYGRGWDEVGAHTLGYNKYSIGIAFIGTFNNEAPPTKQLEACKKLIRKGVALGKLDKNYKLFAHRQLASTLSPGDKLFDILKEWPHFVKNFTDVNELIPNY